MTRNDALKRLDAALCNFTNGAVDEYDPREWVSETERNFKELCDAYNEAWQAGVFENDRP